MAFRDDDAATRARADALARELAARDAEIETLKAELEQKKAKLREVTKEAAPLVERAEKAERAQEALESLKAKNAEHARNRAAEAQAARLEEERAQTAKAQAEAQEREKRLLKSLSSWADLDLIGLLSFAGLPGLWGSLYLGIKGWPLYAVFWPVLLAFGAIAAKHWGRAWARRAARREEEWARSRLYPLDGYPEVLEIKPASRRFTFRRLDEGEHWLLSVELEFADGKVPADLGEVMTGLDPEFTTSNPLPRRHRWVPVPDEPQLIEKPNVFNRLSPVTIGGGDVADHNRAVYEWVRRFECEALRPLHARHPLARVTVRLR